ncbi:MAG: sulfatase-like hydrolase/transferase [Oscillospiraceae bacterium]|nr:sulfatase-like hydrolase/transferase [Oscillospiraceae bacterium]
MKKPNILFLFSDQQRHDTLGCYNSSVDFTPNLDQLAAEGVRFENAFTCQPVCGPARACLQTGLYATQTGCYRNGIPLPQTVTTIADRFGQSGYETAYIGKWHLASAGTKPVPSEQRGGYRDYWMAADLLEFTSDGHGGYMFDTHDRRVDFKGYRADCQTDFVLDYLQNRELGKPFFGFVSYLEPHHQNGAGHYQGPAGSKSRFKDYPVPEDLKAFRRPLSKPVTEKDRQDTAHQFRKRSLGDWAEEYPDYLGCCASLDENVGRIVRALKERGIYENTVIVYTSDHGSHFRTRNAEYKRSCHDSSVHVPLVIRGPGFTGGKAFSELVSLIDLPVTLMQCGGIEIPSGLQGNPLQKLTRGDHSDWPQEVFIQISESQVGRAIRTKRWKYSVKAPFKNGWIHEDSGIYREEFLYDLENDPHELRNLVDRKEYGEVRAELRQRLIKRMTKAGERTPKIIGK